MDQSPNFTPGHLVHHIQARLALESLSSWRMVTIKEICEGFIKIKVEDNVFNFKCVETARLREVFDSGRVPLNTDGDNFVIMAPHNVLIIPCATEGKTFPDEAPINSSVSYMEDGGSKYSPTTDGRWYLFSVAKTGKSDSTTS